jgi:hypothetical protein
VSTDAGIDAQPADKRSGRRIYIVTAALFLVTAIVGFNPNVTAVLEGRYSLPPIVYVHGATMTAWLVLLLVQSVLMARGRARVHRALGTVAFVLVPAMVVVMIAASIDGYHRHLAAGTPRVLLGNALLGEASLVIQFTVLAGIALAARRTAPETHKRMLLIATVPLLAAAAGRMPWLPFTAGTSSEFDYVAALYPLLLLVPAFLYDVRRRGRLHRAYLVGLVIVLVSTAATRELWSSPGWHHLVRTGLEK